MGQVSKECKVNGWSHVSLSICLFSVPIQLFTSPAFLSYCVGDQERLANYQHQHHEGRVKGVLVHPDCRVPVLVQRWGGEKGCSFNQSPPQEFAKMVISWKYPKRLFVVRNTIVVCVPTQHNQCADYCSALVWWTGSLNTGQAGRGVKRTLMGGRTLRSLWLQVTTLGQ